MSCNNNTGLDIIRMVYSSEHKLHSYKGKLWSASSPVSPIGLPAALARTA